MQSADVIVQRGAALGETHVCVADVHRHGLAHQSQALVELGHDRAARHVGPVQVERDVPQSLTSEAVENNVECSALFRDEEHPLATRNKAGDEVGNRLRFACSGWALDDSRSAVQDFFNDAVLARISRKYEEFFIWRLFVQ